MTRTSRAELMSAYFFLQTGQEIFFFLFRSFIAIRGSHQCG